MSMPYGGASITSHLVRLSAGVSVWVKESVGGFLWLARVAHPAENPDDFSVGQWHLLPGGFEHLPTFTYAWQQPASAVGPVAVCPVDGDRFFLAFGLSTRAINYAMVVRSNADGTFTTGPPMTFIGGSTGSQYTFGGQDPVTGNYYYYMSVGVLDSIAVPSGPDRVVMVTQDPLPSVPGTTTGTTTTLRVFHCAGLSVSMTTGLMPAFPGAAVSEKPGLAPSGESTGFWAYQSVYYQISINGYRRHYIAWCTEANGVVTMGPPRLVGDWSSVYILDFEIVPTERSRQFLLRVTRGYYAGFYFGYVYEPSSVTLLRVDEDGALVDEAVYAPSLPGVVRARSGLAGMSAKNLVGLQWDVDRWAGLISLRVRQIAPNATGGYTLPHEAVYLRSDQNVPTSFDGTASLQRHSHRRVLAKWGAARGTGESDTRHRRFIRLALMAVPPVCPPPMAPGQSVGPASIRVAQVDGVVRLPPAPPRIPVTERMVCERATSVFGGGSTIRVRPIGRRR